MMLRLRGGLMGWGRRDEGSNYRRIDLHMHLNCGC